jgi:hypothetical protein
MWYVVIVITGAALLSIVIAKRFTLQRPSGVSARLLQISEARLLSACAGDKTAVDRLIEQERRRHPRLSRVDAAKAAHARINGHRPHWPNEPHSHR